MADGDFDYEDLSERLQDFGVQCDDNDDVIMKINELKRLYHLDADEVTDELMSLLMNDKRMRVDMQTVIDLTSKLERTRKKELEQPTASRKSTARAVLQDVTLSTLAKSFEREAIKANDVQEQPTTSVNSSLYTDFSPYKKSPLNTDFLKRGNAGEEIFCVQGEHFRDDVEVVAPLPTSSESFVRLVSKPPKAFYGSEKLSAIIDATLKRLSDTAKVYKDHYPEIDKWGDAKEPSSEPINTYGEVVRDSTENLPLGEKTVILRLDDDDGAEVRLDLTAVADVSLFQGQAIVVRGVCEDGATLRVERIFAPPPMELAQVGELPAGCATILANTEIWIASGPYTSVENCAYEQLAELLEEVQKKQPTALVLMGPFVDNKNKLVKSNEFDVKYKELFTRLLCSIARKLEGCRTEVIVQPASHRDSSIYNIFPAPAFPVPQQLVKNPKFHFVPDAAVTRVFNEALLIAMANGDILPQLGKGEFHRSSDKENQDRIARLSEHLLAQRTLFPQRPATISASAEDIEDVCALSVAPNLILLPSILPASIKKSANGTVFVNPGHLAKGPSGTFVKVAIRVPNVAAGDRLTQLSAHAKFAIVRI